MDAMDDDARILKELDDEGVLHLILNRPRRKNAFDEPQWDAFAAALDEASEDPRVAVVLLSGAEGNFSSGADLSSFGGDPPPPREDGAPSGYYACINSLYNLDKPLLAAVEGIAIGGGCTLALAADLVYVGRSLRMRLPFASLGLPPEIASSYTLQAAIGRQRAAELMFTAEWIDADRAVEVGIAARAFADDSLLPAAMAKAREMAQWPISALVSIKRCLRVAHRAGIEAAREIEDTEMARLGGSPENIEAIAAFLQKRDPDFKQFRK
jgi:enoyl-CoA hydratase/carnithine racemase